MTTNRPRGRRPDYVHDRQGKLIPGLSCNASDGRFYATHSKPRKWFGNDFDRALILFREWEARQRGTRYSFTVTEPASPAVRKSLEEGAKSKDPKVAAHYKEALAASDDARVIHWRSIPEDIFWSIFRDKFAASPKLCAECSGIPLDRLDKYKDRPPSPRLADLGTMYHDKSGASGEWLYKTQKFWTEFTKSVQVETVRDITQPLITRYYDEVAEAAKSDTYAKHRFGAVKRVFSYAQQRGEVGGKPIDNAELETVLAYCRVFDNYKRNGNKEKPNPITVDNFAKLLNAADEKWEAILLCGLNFCMYAAEVCNLEWTDIDLDRGTLVTQRDKTGKQLRVAVLWNRTLQALRKIKRTDSPYIFNSIYGTQYDPEGLRTAFRKLRDDDAKVAETVKFNNLRDGGIQACIDAGADVTQYRLVSGHALGGRDDDYYRRNPRAVAPACAIIESHYFPTPKTKKGGKK